MVDVCVVRGEGGIFTKYIVLGSVAWDATGGCWRQSLPCSDLCAAVG